MNTHRVKAATCPVCGVMMNAASELNNDHIAPKPGDATICYSCGSLLEFTKEFDLAKLDINILDAELQTQIRNEQSRIKGRMN